MKQPIIIYIDNLLKSIEVDNVDTEVVLSDGSTRWIPARPYAMPSLMIRFKAAWKVFLGSADALDWRGQ